MPTAVEQLRHALGHPSGFDRDQIRAFLEMTDSIEHAVTVARQYTAEALYGLRSLPPSEARSSLEAMAEFIVGRRF